MVRFIGYQFLSAGFLVRVVAVGKAKENSVDGFPIIHGGQERNAHFTLHGMR